MRIFIAGATGVVGRRIVPTLVAAGHEVTGVARGRHKADALRSQGATAVEVDLFDAAAVTAAVDGAEVVVNLATAVPPTSRMLLRSAWEMTNRLRTQASVHLVDAALAAGATRYVQEALGFAYGDHGAQWISEDAPLDVPPYSAGVLTAEAETRRFAESGGTGVALRFGLFYAADSAQTRDALDMARKGLLALPGRDDGYQPWVHIDDAASAVVAALNAPSGAYNAVEDNPLSNAEHVDVLSDLLGRRVRHLPAWLGIGGVLGMQARSQRVSNRRLRASSGWRPSFPSRREGWAAVVSQVAEESSP